MLNVRDRRKAYDRRELAELVEQVGEARIQRLLGVHRTTISRWLTGDVAPPQSVLVALRLELKGRVPGMDGEWNGWYFEDGLLCSPEGQKFDRGQVMASIYERKLLKAQRERIRELERQLVAATGAASAVDPAANDLAIWPQDVRSKAFP